LENGVGSALILSRRLGLARTRVYRILDKLEKMGLVTVRLNERGQRYEAANPKQLAVITGDRELEVKKLKTNLPILEEQLGKLIGCGGGKSKVLYYEGLEGFKQVTWNSLKAKGELFKKLKIKNVKCKIIGGQCVPKVSVVNGDDPHAEYFLSFPADEKVIYGIEHSASPQSLAFFG